MKIYIINWQNNINKIILYGIWAKQINNMNSKIFVKVDQLHNAKIMPASFEGIQYKHVTCKLNPLCSFLQF
jgi:hypothetical protein